MLSENEKEARIAFLRFLGFSEKGIQRMENYVPSLPPVEKASKKFQGLQDRGFTNPAELITACPSIMNIGFENIDRKIEGLRERGFANPVEMITSNPRILTFGFENIDRKIHGLKQRNVIQSLEHISSKPSLIGIALENIDRKIRFLYRVLLKYDFVNKEPDLIVKNKLILGSRFEKIVIITRILVHFNVDNNRKSIFARLLKKNIEDVMICFLVSQDSFEFFMSYLNSDELAEITDQEKRKVIKKNVKKFPTKIINTYLRGYPYRAKRRGKNK